MLSTVDRISKGERALIVCMGDSITEQNYHCHQHLNYVGRLAERLIDAFGRRTFVFNVGISGELTGGALQRLDRDALRFRPDLLLLMYGINDSKKGLDGLAEFRDNLRTLVKRVRESGTELLLLTQNAITYDSSGPAQLRIHYAEYAEAIRETAAELDVPLCDIHARWTELIGKEPEAQARLMDDALHPNERGHDFMARTLFDYLNL